MPKRSGFTWGINEILALQREYELLGLSIDQIAEKHQRTPYSIMYKLDQEGFADYNDLCSHYYNQSNKQQTLELEASVDESDKDSDTVTLSQRVSGLEDSILEIKSMLKEFTSSRKSSRSPCRTAV